jgi:hypothetical protein
VKYILKLALIAVVPALLLVASANAAQHHHHKAGHRESELREFKFGAALDGVAQDTTILWTWGAAMLRPLYFGDGFGEDGSIAVRRRLRSFASLRMPIS